MTDYSMALGYTPASAGLAGTNGSGTVPQEMTTEQFKEYLKEYEPDTFEALDKIGKKYLSEKTSGIECKQLVPARLGAARMPKPQQVKRFWQKFEGWFAKFTGKNHIDADDICDAIDKGSQIWDLSHATPQTYVPVTLPNS